ncbi:MAG: hypothetical protein IJG68_03560 [Bacilli bacterium]|nr:hypothetical protein [Bacilli bacterium]
MTKKKKNENNIEKFKKFVTSYSFLYGLFAFLLVLVIILGIVVFIKGKEKKETTANMVIPILTQGSHNSMRINLYSLKDNDYIIKVTNFRGNETNENNVNYSVTLTNDSNSNIEVTKDQEKENLMIDQNATRIENQSLTGKKKETAIYHIHLAEHAKPSEGDYVTVEIVS